MRANYLIHISLYEDQRARDCCSEKRNRGEAFICLSVFSFVPLRAALKVFVLLSKERICVLGKNPRFCQGALFVLLLFISIAGLSLSLSHASRKRESDESVVILLVSRF